MSAAEKELPDSERECDGCKQRHLETALRDVDGNRLCHTCWLSEVRSYRSERKRAAALWLLPMLLILILAVFKLLLVIWSLFP